MTAQPVRQIVEAQARVMEKTRFILLLSTIAITLTVALCVLATLTASVLERRKDYAVMKALGSSQGAVNAIFLGEALSLAIVGATAGFAAGCGLAVWIGHANFHAAITPSINVFPPVLGGCVLVALFSAVLPLTLLQKNEPAAMLKGE
jgi:putative ABC transport system permease protein